MNYAVLAHITTTATYPTIPGGYPTPSSPSAGIAIWLTLTPISTQRIRRNVQPNSKRKTRPPHHGTMVSVGRLAWRSTGE